MRKRYSPDASGGRARPAAFKAQIVQEFLREEKNIIQIASAHSVHPNLIGEWKAAALNGLPMIFEKGHSELAAGRAAHEKQLSQLYSEIGPLTTQVAWLKTMWPRT